jgi:hypothetical protein
VNVRRQEVTDGPLLGYAGVRYSEAVYT